MTEENVQQEEAVEAAPTESVETSAPAPTAPETGPAAEGRGRRKMRIGVVVGDRGDKTVTVKVERRLAHPLYGKGMSLTKKVHAHDEKNEYRTGDTVRIMETRPLSKTKRWRVVELIERPE
jgi:small subunit ribosomal protein S17